jgi:hypothetical protein
VVEKRVPNQTEVVEKRTGRILKIVDAIETNNQFGYGVYLYRFEGFTHTGFGLYQSEFNVISGKISEKYNSEQIKEILKNHWLLENGTDESELHSIHISDDFKVDVVFNSDVKN